MRGFGGWDNYIYFVAWKLYGWDWASATDLYPAPGCAALTTADLDHGSPRGILAGTGSRLCLKHAGASGLCCDIALAISAKTGS